MEKRSPERVRYVTMNLKVILLISAALVLVGCARSEDQIQKEAMRYFSEAIVEKAAINARWSYSNRRRFSWTFYYNDKTSRLPSSDLLDAMADFIRLQGRFDFNPPAQARVIYATNQVGGATTEGLLSFSASIWSEGHPDDLPMYIPMTEYCQLLRGPGEARMLYFLRNEEELKKYMINQEEFCNTIGVSYQAALEGLPYETQDPSQESYLSRIESLNEEGLYVPDTLDPSKEVRIYLSPLSEKDYERLSEIIEENTDDKASELKELVSKLVAKSAVALLIRDRLSARNQEKFIAWYLSSIYDRFILGTGDIRDIFNRAMILAADSILYDLRY